MFEGSEHELQSCEDEGPCDEEEDYSLISEISEDSDSSNKTSGSDHNYITLAISLETMSRVSSPERTSNTDSTIPRTSVQEGAAQLNPLPKSLNTNPMVATDV